VLVAAREADPEAFRRSEEQLVEATRIHSTNDLQRVASYWRQAVEREHAIEGEEKLREQRRLHASVSLLGMVRVDGNLDPETGETLLTALGAVMDAEARSRDSEDDRTPAQRRADALGEICRRWLDGADRPIVAGERPHVTFTVGADALRGGEGSVSDDRRGQPAAALQTTSPEGARTRRLPAGDLRMVAQRSDARTVPCSRIELPCDESARGTSSRSWSQPNGGLCLSAWGEHGVGPTN